MHSFKYKDITYLCPECGRRQKTDILYIPGKTELELEKGRWCSYCGAIHKFRYILYVRNRQAKLKVVEFSSNDLVHVKRFKLLDQQPKKRKKRK